jgi:hypothetical protein
MTTAREAGRLTLRLAWLHAIVVWRLPPVPRGCRNLMKLHERASGPESAHGRRQGLLLGQTRRWISAASTSRMGAYRPSPLVEATSGSGQRRYGSERPILSHISLASDRLDARSCRQRSFRPGRRRDQGLFGQALGTVNPLPPLAVPLGDLEARASIQRIVKRDTADFPIRHGRAPSRVLGVCPAKNLTRAPSSIMLASKVGQNLWISPPSNVMAMMISRLMSVHSASGEAKPCTCEVAGGAGAPPRIVFTSDIPKNAISAQCHHFSFSTYRLQSGRCRRRYRSHIQLGRRPKPDVGNPLRQRAHAPVPASRLDMRACHPATNS